MSRNKGTQAAAALNSSYISLLYCTTRPKNTAAKSTLKHWLQFCPSQSLKLLTYVVYHAPAPVWGDCAPAVTMCNGTALGCMRRGQLKMASTLKRLVIRRLVWN